MEYVISEYVTIWKRFSEFELMIFDPYLDRQNESVELMQARAFGNPTRIRIKEKWYDVIPLGRVLRSPSPVDGRFHFLYIQINLITNEYYIGKVNRKRWTEIKRYQGSGLRFKAKYKGNETNYIRYFIGCFSTQKETEDAEASIVDEEFLKDEKCLNLVCGGGGTSEHYDREKRVAFQRQYMKEHPERYQAMLDASKQLFADPSFQKRKADKLKVIMSDDRYRKMMSERITRWRRENPEAYQQAREKNGKAIQTPEVQEKRRQARQKWISEHPEEHKAQQERLNEFRQSPEAREKRAASLKAFAENNPEQAQANLRKRSAASVEKCRKPVNMCDLETGEILRTFKSQHEAAQWLVDAGLAKNMNCVSSINSVCQRKPCTTGYGYRKKAYGYDWQYAEKEEESKSPEV